MAKQVPRGDCVKLDRYKGKQSVLFVPKRWLRFTPWLNYDDYFNNYLIKDIEKEYDGSKNRIEVLKYNRENFGMVERYISLKEADRGNCENDPLFSKISVESAKRKVSYIKSLPIGKTDNADKKYEELMGQVLTSFLYPHLDFAAMQSRVEREHVNQLNRYMTSTFGRFGIIFTRIKPRSCLLPC